ncbi:hypothetical protein [Albimonas pacifica]|uniref:Uncharacterized protein n=1 Tax=Albimonas pacifica TaxID=1114924 RepID=A0A1I3JJS6_9RHOB|nr:hypothetical protein [Albimonas pacifica]SFI60434.1 hypothetical protein SAMN05216258_10835 [Albimonas pacifica]
MSGGEKTAQAQRLAAEAADRIGSARQAGEQLSLLAAPEPAAPVAQDEGERRGPGRPLGSRNRAKRAELRKLFAARGWAMPEDQLARLAGLDLGGGDLFTQAMARAEQLLAWAQDGAREEDDGEGNKAVPAPTMGQRLSLALSLLGEMRKAQEALLPYGLAKVTPDTAGAAPPNFIVLPGQPVQSQPGDGARVVEGQARPVGPSDFAPPPMPGDFQRNQGLADDVDPEDEA